MKNQMIGLMGILLALPAWAQVREEPIRGEGLPPQTIVWTVDDGPDELGPDGDNQMLKVARYLGQQGIPATFFVTGYPFANQPPVDHRSLIGQGVVGTFSQEILREIVALGHGHSVGNHSQDHLVLPELVPGEVWYQFMQRQWSLDELQSNGFHPFRTPGLWWNEYVYNVLKAHPYLAKMTGPIDQDVGGQGWLEIEGKSVWIGGDWDCYRRGIEPEVCGELYVQAIRQIHDHGAILLMHVRTEDMNGKDGSRDFPLRLAAYIVSQLGREYHYLPLEALTGTRGPIETVRPVPVRQHPMSNKVVK